MEVILLAFKTGEFFQDMILPAIAVGFVLVLILNSILQKFGFRLW